MNVMIGLQTARKKVHLFFSSLVAILLIVALFPHGVSAAQIVDRSLTIGSVEVSANTTHEFLFSFFNVQTVGSLLLQYCDSPLDQLACVAPAGLDVSGVTLQSQSGETGFSIFSATSNEVLLSRLPSATATSPNTYNFSDAINPSQIGTFYVRIYSYAATDGTGSFNNFGALANSTVTGVSISSIVPPILNFCVAQIIPTDCSSAAQHLVELGTLSASSPTAGTSQMIVGTNAEFGAVITVSGSTMTSGTSVIPALTVPTASAPGNSQFGINLRANTNPTVGQNKTGPGVMNPASGYNTPNLFKYQTGDVVASTPAVTDIVKFTVSYLVNVSPAQLPGVYNTTLTYICTATF